MQKVVAEQATEQKFSPHYVRFGFFWLVLLLLQVFLLFLLA
jgi:hypothetical protein